MSAELRAAANDTENDILFRRANRRKNRSSLARLHEYFIGASTAKWQVLSFENSPKIARNDASIFFIYWEHPSANQERSLWLHNQAFPLGRFSTHFYLTDGSNSLFYNVFSFHKVFIGIASGDLGEFKKEGKNVRQLCLPTFNFF